MQTDAFSLWLSRIVTFTIAGLAAASAVYWGLKTWQPSTPVLAPALAGAAPVGAKALALALGGGQAPQAPSAAAPALRRYTLLGVAAENGQGGRTGAALISVDGQPAKPVRVGALVEGAWLLRSVTGRRAVLSSSDGSQMTLELPSLSPVSPVSPVKPLP